MPEEKTGAFGEAAPESSPDQTTEPVEETQEGAQEEAQETATEEGQQVPYERFNEVNGKYRDTQAELETANAEIENLKQSQTPEETPKFETQEELINYQKENIGKDVDQKLKERDGLWESRLEAERKMNELNQAFPEIKEDRHFADFVTTKLQQNPGMDVMKAAQEAKEYFATYEKKGRKAAEQDFIQKGSFQGGVEGNQPLQKSDADQSIADSIVNAGGNSADEVF